MPQVSVIMVSYQTGPLLLKSVRAAASDPDVDELILIDHDNPVSDRLAVLDLASDLESVRLIQGHGNIGFACGCNYGAALARGDHLLFLNPDALVQPGAIKALLDASQGVPRPWIAGGLLLDEKGIEQRGSRRGPLTLMSALSAFLGLRIIPGWPRFHRHHETLPDQAVPMPTVSGACLMMDRASFDAMGGFDPHYFLHVEDVELCRRVRAANGTVLFVPDAAIVHHGGTSDATRWHVERHKLNGFLRYFWTAGPGLGPKLSTLFLAPFIAIALGLRVGWKTLKRAS